MKLFLYYLVQCTWGAIQTFLGFILFLFNFNRPHFFYRNAMVTVWKNRSGLSLGAFIFVPSFKDTSRTDIQRRIIVHEYGHTIQSLILGPLYLPVIGLPSLIWNNVPAHERRGIRRNYSYYSFYTERWANHLGELITKEKSLRPENVM